MKFIADEFCQAEQGEKEELFWVSANVGILVGMDLAGCDYNNHKWKHSLADIIPLLVKHQQKKLSADKKIEASCNIFKYYQKEQAKLPNINPEKILYEKPKKKLKPKPDLPGGLNKVFLYQKKNIEADTYSQIINSIPMLKTKLNGDLEISQMQAIHYVGFTDPAEVKLKFSLFLK
jgi:hypothetical protein